MSGEAVAAWAASGAMWLTGHPAGPPLAPAAAVVPALDALAEDVRRGAAAVGAPAEVRVDVGEALAGRAALLGLARRGRTSANGTCRLLPAADGWVAVNLARPADIESVGALVERAVGGDDPWPALARWVERTPADAVVERAALLGVPAGRLPTPGAPWPAVTTATVGPAGPSEARPRRRPRRNAATVAGAWWSTCRRCGPAPCAPACSAWPACGS